MSTDSTLNPLDITNPRRQAADTIRAYEYQIWQSVSRWVTLKPGEELFLEKAEDFDVIGEGAAETIQVKDTSRSGSITLNSESVIEAITNFWAHQRKNPNHHILFRLLTTSPRGMEKLNPFGGVKGLDYWDRCKGSTTPLKPLRDLLSGNAALPESLRHYLLTSSDEEVRRNLINRIEWASDQGDHESIKELIRRRVVAYGMDAYSLQPAESEKVISHLFTHVLKVIRESQDRRLDLADFGAVFERHTTRRFTPQEIQNIRSLAGPKKSMPGGVRGKASAPADHFGEVAEDLYDLPLLENLAKRNSLVSELEARLISRGLLVLKGSSGMGKSTLAVLIAKKERERWKRLDFRDSNAEQIKERLMYATVLDAEERRNVNYIVDDLNFDERPSAYEQTLAGFIHAVVSRGGRMIITTQGEVPSRVTLSLDLAAETLYEVPPLTEEEIRSMAVKHGCLNDKILNSWGRIIQATTAGHPQLVHARVKRLASDGWPQPQLDRLFEDAGADEVRQEARRRLREYLPSDQARTLAYRLSIYAGPFKRSHALHTAQHPPALTNPGETFDLLVGPWVESYGRGYYKLSPLLKNSAKEMFGQEGVNYLHKTATYSFFADTDNVLTPTEINGILIHGLLGETPEPLDRIAQVTETVKGDKWVIIAREIDWFAHLPTESDERLFKSNPITSLNLRRLQFRIAAAVDSTRLAPKVVLNWDRELQRLGEFMDMPKFFVVRLVLQQMFNTILFRLDVPIPIRNIVRNIVTAVAWGKQWEAVADSDELVREALKTRQKEYEKLPKAEMQMLQRELGSDLGKIVDISDDVYITAVRCNSAEDVADFIDELERQTSNAADEVWAYLRSNEFTSTILVNAAWLGEVKAAAPNWERTLEVLDKVTQVARARDVDHLAAAAYQAKAIVLKEHAKGKGDAIEVINEGVRELGYPHPILHDYLAKIYMLDGRYAEAIDIWRQIPPEDEDRLTSMRIFSHHDALTCAGRLSDWRAVEELALEGEKVARRLCHMGDVIAVGYQAEHALAVWKSGGAQQGLNAFAIVASEMKSLPDPSDDLKSYTLLMRINHTIKWLGEYDSADERGPEPRPGLFSDFKNQEIEREKAFPQGVAVPLLQIHIEQLRLKHSLRSLSIGPLISEYAKLSTYSKEVAGRLNAPITESFDLPMIYALVFAALVNWLGNNKPFTLPVDRWREDAGANGLFDPNIKAYLDFVGRAIDEEDSYLRKLLDEPDEPAERKLIASLVLSHRRSLTSEDRFVVNTNLVVTGNAYAMWRQVTEDIVCNLVTDGWKAVTELQRISLSTPTLTVPNILSAILDNSTSGLKKAAKVLLAARFAVNVRLPQEVINRLTELAAA
jgi:tetratricopeptide (TPR) repeat protein